MANQSSADVVITAKASIAKELFDYIKAVQTDSEYNIINEDAFDDIEKPEEIDTPPDPEAEVYITGWATGRWSYGGSNLPGYFAGRLNDDTWRYEKAAHITFAKLVSAIKRKDGYFEIEYKDQEGGAGFIDLGTMRIDKTNVDDDQPMISSETIDYSISNMMETFGYSEYEALDNMYGDEIADAWSDYSDQGGVIEDAESFYDEYGSDIYEGNFEVEEVLLEEQRKLKEGEATETP